jgi:hypothetical protein
VAVVSVAACGIAAGCLVLLEISLYGPALSPDSVNYIAAARHVLRGEGFLDYNGGLYTHWPPLFPSVLALLGLTGVDLVWLCGLLNALVCGLIVAVCGTWLLHSSKSRILPILGTVAVIFPISLVSRFAWSEPLFILFAVLSLWQMARYLSSQEPGWPVLAAIPASLACLTRYIGVTVPVTGCLLLLLALRAPLRKRLAACFVLGTVSIFPLTLWLIRNWLAVGHLVGAREASTTGLLANVSRTGQVLGGMLLPGRLGLLLPGALWFVGLMTIGAGAGVLVSHRKHRRGEDWMSAPAFCALAFLGVYTSAIVVCATLVAFDALNHRLLSPVCAPGVVLVFLVLDEVFFDWDGRAQRPGNRRRLASKAARSAVFVVLSLWLSAASARTFIQVKSCLRTGAGDFSSRRWQESETIAYLRLHDVRRPVFSNVPKAVYILTGRQATDPPGWSVHAGEPGIGDRGPKEFRSHPPSDGAGILVWFDREGKEVAYDPTGVRGFSSMQRMAAFPDGSIYLIHAAPLGSGEGSQPP